jgi:lipopolysaccharide biosynthesis protein
MNRDSYLLRKMHSARTRFRNQLQHWLLRLLEITPAPWCFALRNFLFKQGAPLFSGTDAYIQWQAAVKYFDTQRSPKIQIIDLSKIPSPTSIPAKKIAIQAHIFYSDLAPELAKVLTQFPAPFDLLISTPDSQNEEFLRSQFQGIGNLKNLKILITPNRGRDLGPLLYGFGKELLNYDCFAHIHTKKSSATNDIGNSWRQYLVQGLLDSSQDRTLKILGLLEEYGLVYPQKFPFIDVQNCQWGENLKNASALCESMQIPTPSPGYIEFPTGSMFWAKTAALKPLLEHPFAPNDFEVETGQTDHTIMHAIERSLGHISLSQGYPIALLRYPSAISFYP